MKYPTLKINTKFEIDKLSKSLIEEIIKDEPIEGIDCPILKNPSDKFYNFLNSILTQVGVGQLIESAPDATQKKERSVLLFCQVQEIFNSYKEKRYSSAIMAAFEIGQELIKEQLLNKVPKRAGRKLAADPLYWGKKVSDYYKEQRGEGESDREARKWAYKQVKKDWKKEYKEKLDEHPIPSNDTFLNWHNIYLEQNPPK